MDILINFTAHINFWYVAVAIYLAIGVYLTRNLIKNMGGTGGPYGIGIIYIFAIIFMPIIAIGMRISKLFKKKKEKTDESC
ncbi:MAG: hypothetical protein WC979_00175 [Candidatus Pacearchaeota archaeon]|jgi:hypothetical protein|nr:hypothetical protein [Clostridia bacterium]